MDRRHLIWRSGTAHALPGALSDPAEFPATLYQILRHISLADLSFARLTAAFQREVIGGSRKPLRK
jgi:hypothetical protein